MTKRKRCGLCVDFKKEFRTVYGYGTCTVHNIPVHFNTKECNRFVLRSQQGEKMRKFTCPAWWYQSVDYEKKPDWEECIGMGSFSNCKHFKNKDFCWERFDKEQKK